MNKKLLAFLCIVSIVLISGIVIMFFYYNPDNFVFPEGSTYRGATPFQPENAVPKVRHTQQAAPVKKFIAGTCALLLVGYLFFVFYRRFHRDSIAESTALETTLHKISVETGRTEYELFLIAAEGWSVSENRIDVDFKYYMADHVLPYYVVDFVRKNFNHIDQSLRKEEEIEPTSLWDYVKALIIFSGILLLLPLLGIIFGHNVLK